METTVIFSTENTIHKLMLELLESRVDNLIEQTYYEMQANTVASHIQLSEGREYA